MQNFVAVYAQFNANEKLLAESATSFISPPWTIKMNKFQKRFQCKKVLSKVFIYTGYIQ